MEMEEKTKIKEIYGVLYRAYGKQGWWPTTPKGKIKPEYVDSKRNLTEKEIFEICIGAILTQNTSWKNAEKSIIQLNKNKLMQKQKLMKSEDNSILKLIRSSGYYNQKTRTIRNFLEFAGKKSLKKYFKKDVDWIRKSLLDIKGIGKETADSILLYAANKPIFVIDAYTKRIFNRLGFKQNTYDELQNLFHSGLKKDTKTFNEYHALLVEFGKRICRKKPLCNQCFFKKQCLYFKKNNRL